MKERSLIRLGAIAERFGTRILEAEAARNAAPESFFPAFAQAREAVILPVFRETAAEVERLGHRAAVEIDEVDPNRPAVSLRLFLTSLRPLGHRVTFVVIDRGKGLQVLACLEATAIVTDIARYTPAELTRDVVEQVTVDAVEHIFSCVAELR